MFIPGGSAIPTSGYDINNSVRLRRSASAYLSRSFSASSTDRKKGTLSFWIKRGVLSTQQCLIDSYDGSSTGSFNVYYLSGDTIVWRFGGGALYANTTSAVYRDPSAWYNVVLVWDTTQATDSNRMKLYINGTQQTFGTTSYPALNATAQFPQNGNTKLCCNYNASGEFSDVYLAEYYFIDGQALTPSSFGATDAVTGVWAPAAYTGSYGTNGFYLKFSDIATTSGSNAGLGKDFSGNGNYWTTNNISVTAGTTYDAMTDSPTLTSATVSNYCAGNPLDVSVRGAFTNGNLTCTTNGGGALNGGSARLNTFNFTQLPVKWYWESTVTNTGGGRAGFGMITTAYIAQNEAWSATGGWYLRSDGVQSGLTNPGTFTTNDVMMFAYDGNTGKVWIGKNGTWTNSGVPASGTGQNATLTVGTEYWLLFNENTGGAGTAVCEMNYGQRPFSYTPPTGFNRLNAYNLPDSTIKKGNSYMDATLYTGTGSALTVTNAASFQPDFVWLKSRSAAQNHNVFDSNRGTTKRLNPNLADFEDTASGVTSFNSNGFTLGTNSVTNTNTNTYVAWQWQAGQGTTSSNTSGNITSTVDVSTTAGCSIITYTGNGTSTQTVGHGLGVAPKFIIVKARSSGATMQGWFVWHTSLTSGYNLRLELTDAQFALSGTSNGGIGSSPSSTTFTLANGSSSNSNVNQNTITYVAYAWSEIAGFSKFGSYTGNGSADGTFVYTGFRPKFIIWKRSDAVENWGIWTPLANGNGIASSNNFMLFPNLANAQDTTQIFDTLSNGFKNRDSGSLANANGGTYIYAAFAENPFKNALAR